MTKAEIIALAERVERAEGPSLVLDRDVALAIYPGAKPVPGVDARISVWDGNGLTQRTVKPYTASLDAAMSLVPEDWHLSLSMGRINIVTLTEDSDDPVAPARVFEASASTPALALTAASLRAIAEEMD